MAFFPEQLGKPAPER